MRSVSLEQILVLIIFILLPFVHWILRQVSRRKTSEAPPPYIPESPGTVERLPRRRIAENSPGSSFVRERQAQLPEPVRGRGSPAALGQTRRRHFTASALFANKAELRRAVILMTVLGPCRVDHQQGF